MPKRVLAKEPHFEKDNIFYQDTSASSLGPLSPLNRLDCFPFDLQFIQDTV